jgi:DNA topoisomerase IB
VFLLQLNGHSVKQYGTDFANWNKGALTFAKAFGIGRVYVQSANLYLNGKFDEDQAQVLGKAIKSKVKEFEKDVSISREQLRLMKDVQNNLRTASEAAWNRIHNDVAFMRNPRLSASFTHDDDVPVKGVDPKFDPQKNATKMKAIGVLVNAKGAFLDEDQTKALREQDPKKYSEYAALIKPINALIKVTTFNFVRASGEPLVLIDELKKHLDKKGIPNNVVTGLTGGYIDEKGKCYTAEKRMLDKVPYGVVVMNKNYDPVTDDVFVCKAITQMRKEFRTVTMNQANKGKKFSSVGEFVAKEKEIREAWRADVMGGDDGAKKDKRKQVIATIVELIYQTNSRIGGVGNATKGEPTYGMSTLQVQHLQLTSDQISYNYTGKKGAEQTAHVKVNTPLNKRIHKILTQLIKGKGPTDLVFTYNNKKILGEAVNTYLKSIGSPVTIHKFRNVAGTMKAKEIIKNSPFKKSDNPSQTAVEKWFKAEAVKIGELLMHRNGEKFTGSTSIASYIDPQVIIDYFTSLGLRSPSFLK